MINKTEFIQFIRQPKDTLLPLLPVMIEYKTFIQYNVLDIASQQEINDIRDCRINQTTIDKLTMLAHSRWQNSGMETLYCAAMAVATIIKEYDWGTYYLSESGLYELATRIENS